MSTRSTEDEKDNLLHVVACRTRNGASAVHQNEPESKLASSSKTKSGKEGSKLDKVSAQESNHVTNTQLSDLNEGKLNVPHDAEDDDGFVLKVVGKRLQQHAHGQESQGGSESLTPLPQTVEARRHQTAHSSSEAMDIPELRRGEDLARSQRPGAYPSRPVDSLGDTTSDTQSVVVGDDHDAAASTTPNNEEGLAVATMVDEENPADLQQAQNFDHMATEKKQEIKTFKTKILLGVILAIAIIIILVAVVMPDKASSRDGALEGKPPVKLAHTPAFVEEGFLSLLDNGTVAAIQEDPDSPQALAFHWLIDDVDQASPLSNQRIIQRFVLTTLYYATTGDSWVDNTNWLNHSIHECDWAQKPDFAMMDAMNLVYQFYISNLFLPDEPAPPTCNEDGLYQHLWLDQNNLDGSLPTEVYMLTTLETFSVGWDIKLDTTISTHIGKLTALKGLGMAFLPNGGTLPSEIGLLTNLMALATFSNNFHGQIPSELWQLTNLGHVSLGRNTNLQGSIPAEIGNMSKLQWMILAGCDLSGTIPTETGIAESLKWLILYQSGLTGPIPSEIGQLPEMENLSLENNLLQSTLPTELGLMTSLDLLFSVYGNQITGPIPSELGLLTNLFVSLQLSNNHLSSTIPSELGLLTALREIEAFGNQISGSIPSELAQLTSIGQLNFARNFLSGTVPKELSFISESLNTLNLLENPDLTGTIPEALCHINGTCAETSRAALDTCEGPYGFSFDCTRQLCGCGCPCTVENSQNQTL